MILRLIIGAAVALSSVSSLSAQDVDVSIAGGKAPLFGSYRAPQGFVRGAAVLMIAGSGPTDRNGDSKIPGVRPGTFRLLADALAQAGIPSLRFDKRAIGASAAAAPAETDIRFNDMVKDAASWAQFLKAQPGVTCVVVFGHSEGALIGAAIAAHAPVCGVIEASGAGRPLDAVVEAQFARAGAPSDVQDQVRATFASLKQGKTVETPPRLAALFRPSVQPYLISALKYDPVATLKQVKAPVLIVQGDNDLQVSVEDARLLAAAQPKAKLVVIPGMNHVLKEAPTERAGNIATYGDPALPLAPGVTSAVIEFVHGIGHD